MTLLFRAHGLLSCFCLLGCAVELTGLDDKTDGVLSGEYRIFVTSTVHQGDFGRRAGADAICRARASAAGLTRTYRALIAHADEGTMGNPNVRYRGAGAVYAACGSQVFRVSASLDAMWSPPLDAAVQCDENGRTVSTNVWTGAIDDGDFGQQTCFEWNSSLSVASGFFGNPSQRDAGWIQEGLLESCDTPLSLYCISD